jgi:hypothetical protein
MEGHVNELTNNNNQQTVLNQDFKSQINKLTEKYNKWSNHQAPEDDANIYLLEELSQIQRKIDKIFTTIHLARGNIVNQGILEREIMEQVSIWAKNSNLTVKFITQYLDFAKVAIGISWISANF